MGNAQVSEKKKLSQFKQIIQKLEKSDEGAQVDGRDLAMRDFTSSMSKAINTRISSPAQLQILKMGIDYLLEVGHKDQCGALIDVMDGALERAIAEAPGMLQKALLALVRHNVRSHIEDIYGVGLMRRNLRNADEYNITEYFLEDLRIYLANPENSESSRFYGGYSVLACKAKTVNLSSVLGKEAIICLDDGRLVMRQIFRSKNREGFDLHDHLYGPDPVIMRDVKPRWAAAIAQGMPPSTWEEMMAKGQVKILRDLQ